MSGQIALPIAVYVEASYNHPARDWLFPNSGVDGIATPCDVPRWTDVYGDEPGHDYPRLDPATPDSNFMSDAPFLSAPIRDKVKPYCQAVSSNACQPIRTVNIRVWSLTEFYH